MTTGAPDFDPFAHNPDQNPAWTPLVARRRYACAVCGAERENQTNHTGTIYQARCEGSCRYISRPHTAHERVFPAYTTHRYVAEA